VISHAPPLLSTTHARAVHPAVSDSITRLSRLSPFVLRLSDSRDSIKDIVDTLSDKVSDAKGDADDLQQKIQDVKYEEHDKLEAARIGF
jgi:hypothetical protein